MISEKTRVVNSWQEATTVLAKNCSLQAQNINDLERMVMKLDRKNRIVGICLVALGVMGFTWGAEYTNIHNRLDRCEKQLEKLRGQGRYKLGK